MGRSEIMTIDALSKLQPGDVIHHAFNWMKLYFCKVSSKDPGPSGPCSMYFCSRGVAAALGARVDQLVETPGWDDVARNCITKPQSIAFTCLIFHGLIKRVDAGGEPADRSGLYELTEVGESRMAMTEIEGRHLLKIWNECRER